MHRCVMLIAIFAKGEVCDKEVHSNTPQVIHCALGCEALPLYFVPRAAFPASQSQ